MPRIAVSWGRRPADFQLELVGDFKLPSLTWLVDGVLPAKGVGFIAGASGSGKSFLALDIALRLASGLEVLGRPAHPGRDVVYVAAEASPGVRRRVVAWNSHHGEPTDRFVLVGRGPHLGESESVDALLSVLEAHRQGLQGARRRIDLLILDTLSASMPGMDENAAADMSKAMAALHELSARLDCLVLVVAHTGKDESRGIRGWSGQFAAADCVLMMSRDGELRDVKVAKLKDASEGERFCFQLKPVACTWGSVTVESAIPDYLAPSGGPRKPGLTADQQKVLTAIAQAAHQTAMAVGADVPSDAHVALKKEAFEKAREMGFASDAKPSSAQKRFSRCVETLADRGKISVDGGHIILPSARPDSPTP